MRCVITLKFVETRVHGFSRVFPLHQSCQVSVAFQIVWRFDFPTEKNLKKLFLLSKAEVDVTTWVLPRAGIFIVRLSLFPRPSMPFYSLLHFSWYMIHLESRFLYRSSTFLLFFLPPQICERGKRKEKFRKILVGSISRPWIGFSCSCFGDSWRRLNKRALISSMEEEEIVFVNARKPFSGLVSSKGALFACRAGNFHLHDDVKWEEGIYVECHSHSLFHRASSSRQLIILVRCSRDSLSRVFRAIIVCIIDSF